jgi:hypothetical protein
MSTPENELDSKDTTVFDEPACFKRLTSQVDPERFKYGVLIRGKFIGVEDVKEDNGDELCNYLLIF